MDKRFAEPGANRDIPVAEGWSRLNVFAVSSAIVTVLIVIGLASARISNGRDIGPAVSPAEYSYKVVNTYPHDNNAFCQGLDFDGQTLFESTGRYGQSSVRRVDLESGRVEKQLNLDRRLFGEGLTLMDGKLYQLTWKRGLGYVYDADSLQLIRTFRYRGEGWGITHDGKHLIMSDGSDRLKFLDPKTFRISRTVRVNDGRRPVRQLNELEFVDGKILANIWHSNRIAMISPDSGDVTSWIDLSGLQSASRDPQAVLNGIAYEDGRLFVTGKNWARLYEIELIKQ